jgi:hypothetical protein
MIIHAPQTSTFSQYFMPKNQQPPDPFVKRNFNRTKSQLCFSYPLYAAMAKEEETGNGAAH